MQGAAAPVKNSMEVPQKTKHIEFLCDPENPLLGKYVEKTIIEKDTCTPMFIVALFTKAKTWKQPKYPSADEWIKKMWCIYTMGYSAIEYYGHKKRMK